MAGNSFSGTIDWSLSTIFSAWRVGAASGAQVRESHFSSILAILLEWKRGCG